MCIHTHQRMLPEVKIAQHPPATTSGWWSFVHQKEMEMEERGLKDQLPRPYLKPKKQISQKIIPSNVRCSRFARAMLAGSNRCLVVRVAVAMLPPVVHDSRFARTKLGKRVLYNQKEFKTDKKQRTKDTRKQRVPQLAPHRLPHKKRNRKVAPTVHSSKETLFDKPSRTSVNSKFDSLYSPTVNKLAPIHSDDFSLRNEVDVREIV